MAAATTSPSTKYFLVNLSGVVSILYGMTKYFELVQTSCYYALKGNYSQVHPNAPVVPPDLQVFPGGARDVDQAVAFQVVEVRAPILSDMVQVLRANSIQQRVVQLDAAGNPPFSVMWRALPVHPKMALLFFQGMVAREALLQASALYQGLPLIDREQIAPLLTFLLGAVTEDAADPCIMSNQSGWRHKDPGKPRPSEHGTMSSWLTRPQSEPALPWWMPEEPPCLLPCFPQLCRQIALDNWRTCLTPSSGAIRMGSQAGKVRSTTSMSSSSWQAFAESPEIPALGATSLWTHSRTSGSRSRECTGVTCACELLLKATLQIAPRRVPGSTASSSLW
jgi:hypothetical protein